MMEKRLFQVLDEMNQADTNHGTRKLAIGNTLLNTRKVKAGMEVTMGIDTVAGMDIISDKSIAILLVIDRAEYDKLK